MFSTESASIITILLPNITSLSQRVLYLAIITYFSLQELTQMINMNSDMIHNILHDHEFIHD